MSAVWRCRLGPSTYRRLELRKLIQSCGNVIHQSSAAQRRPSCAEAVVARAVGRRGYKAVDTNNPSIRLGRGLATRRNVTRSSPLLTDFDFSIRCIATLGPEKGRSPPPQWEGKSGVRSSCKRSGEGGGSVDDRCTERSAGGVQSPRWARQTHDIGISDWTGYRLLRRRPFADWRSPSSAMRVVAHPGMSLPIDDGQLKLYHGTQRSHDGDVAACATPDWLTPAKALLTGHPRPLTVASEPCHLDT